MIMSLTLTPVVLVYFKVRLMYFYADHKINAKYCSNNCMLYMQYNYNISLCPVQPLISLFN